MVNWKSQVLELLLAVIIGLACCYCYAANAVVVEFLGALGKECPLVAEGDLIGRLGVILSKVRWGRYMVSEIQNPDDAHN